MSPSRRCEARPTSSSTSIRGDRRHRRLPARARDFPAYLDWLAAPAARAARCAASSTNRRMRCRRRRCSTRTCAASGRPGWCLTSASAPTSCRSGSRTPRRRPNAVRARPLRSAGCCRQGVRSVARLHPGMARLPKWRAKISGVVAYANPDWTIADHPALGRACHRVLRLGPRGVGLGLSGLHADRRPRPLGRDGEGNRRGSQRRRAERSCSIATPSAYTGPDISALPQWPICEMLIHRRMSRCGG